MIHSDLTHSEIDRAIAIVRQQLTERIGEFGATMYLNIGTVPTEQARYRTGPGALEREMVITVMSGADGYGVPISVSRPVDLWHLENGHPLPVDELMGTAQEVGCEWAVTA